MTPPLPAVISFPFYGFLSVCKLYADDILPKLNNIACNNLFSLPGFNLSIHQNVALGDYELGFATTADHAFEFENFIELNGFFCNFNYSHEHSIMGL